MHCAYRDIVSKIDEAPQWWDENAVPRYCEFHPKECANIYAREAALVRIVCQGCRTPYDVAFTHDTMDKARGINPLSIMIQDHEIHYGDPPNTKCCPAGATMNSEPIRVLQYWYRNADTNHDWERVQVYEIYIGED